MSAHFMAAGSAGTFSTKVWIVQGSIHIAGIDRDDDQYRGRRERGHPNGDRNRDRNLGADAW
jgi:hypothetical protein